MERALLPEEPISLDPMESSVRGRTSGDGRYAPPKPAVLSEKSRIFIGSLDRRGGLAAVEADL